MFLTVSVDFFFPQLFSRSLTCILRRWCWKMRVRGSCDSLDESASLFCFLDL
jgi:hypothetical protein